MSKIPSKDLLPANVRAQRLKSGRVAFYWKAQTKDRKAGRAIASEALGTDLAAAIVRAGELNAMLAEVRRADSSAGPIPGTVAWLFANVEKHPKFTKTAAKTQRSYLQGFRLLEAYTLPKSGRKFAQAPVDQVTTGVVDNVYADLQWVEEEGEDGAVTRRRRLATANSAMRAARRAWSIGLRAGWVKDNPFVKMELESTGGSTRPATRAEIEAFMAQADKMGHPSMAAAAMLAFEFCQREGDVIGTIAWTDYRPGSEIRIVQHKTGTPVWVPLHDDQGELFPGLIERLDALPRRGTLIVMRDAPDRRAPKGSDGKRVETYLPYKEDHFRHLFREIADAAGLDKDLKFMGLRHGGLTELGDAGATDQEMQSHGGHKTRQMLTVYSKPTQRQALNAARRRRALRTESAQSTQ